jgi:glucose-fructose oxidoreductase
MKKVRYAVVGLGHIAQVAILPGFKTAKNSELAALVSSDSEKLKKLGKKYKIDRLFSYEQYDSALTEVDAVYVSVPNHLHREYAVRAANAGVHILCEKPMAVDEEECKEMIDVAEENNVKLMIAYRLHFEQANLEAIKLARSGKLGDIRWFSSDFAQQVSPDNVRLEDYKKGGGPLYDMGVYCINAARYLFGAEPTEVFGANVKNDDPRFKKSGEMVSAIMHFPDDRIATFTCSFGAADIGRYSLIGTKGVLTADPGYEYAGGLKHQVVIGDKTTKKNFPKRDQFAAEISYFSDCILKNKEPEPGGLEGLADVRIVRAIYESAATDQAVELPPFSVPKRPGMRQEIRKPAHGKPKVVKAHAPSD